MVFIAQIELLIQFLELMLERERRACDHTHSLLSLMYESNQLVFAMWEEHPLISKVTLICVLQTTLNHL